MISHVSSGQPVKRGDGTNSMDLYLNRRESTKPMQAFVFDLNGEIRVDKTMHAIPFQTACPLAHLC